MLQLFPNAPLEERRDFLTVWNWTDEEIVHFLEGLITNSLDDTKSLVNKNVADPADVVTAANKIYTMLNTRSVSSVSRNDIKDKSLAFKYCGVALPFVTVYDQLGFILSATGTLPPNQSQTPSADYYLPLLSLYAKWCYWLAIQCLEAGQQMQHITYFARASNDHDFCVLLGSSIGSKSDDLRKGVLNLRIAQMDAHGITRPTADLKETHGNYGVCAETMLYIFYANQSMHREVQGFAINTNHENWREINDYNGLSMKSFLRNPCEQSCQHVMGQSKLDWERCFNIRELGFRN